MTESLQAAQGKRLAMAGEAAPGQGWRGGAGQLQAPGNSSCLTAFHNGALRNRPGAFRRAL